jgi:hypothetical protein
VTRLLERIVPSEACSIDGCDRPHEARGWCSTHYRRWKTHGDPLFVKPQPTKGQGPAQHFLRTVLNGTAPTEPNGCILRPFARDGGGYAHAAEHRGRINVYRVVLEHFHGPRPSERHTAGHALHEICGNRHCIAPAHLSWQTPWEQNQQQIREGTTRTGNPTKATPEERVAVARRAASGETHQAIADDLGVHRQTVYKWVKWVRQQGDAG